MTYKPHLSADPITGECRRCHMHGRLWCLHKSQREDLTMDRCMFRVRIDFRELQKKEAKRIAKEKLDTEDDTWYNN